MKTKIKKAENNVYVDVAFWGGVIPGNQVNTGLTICFHQFFTVNHLFFQPELLNLVNAGVVGFKCFLCPSGVDEFPHVDENDLNKSLEILENTKAVLAVPNIIIHFSNFYKKNQSNLQSKNYISVPCRVRLGS